MPSEHPPVEPTPGRNAEVAAMFDRIAGRYDLLNRLLSLGIDQLWRRTALGVLEDRMSAPPRRLLDVATGTADVALALARRFPGTVTGVDPSAGMLGQGQEKVTRAGLGGRITLTLGASEKLPFSDGQFDGAAVAFGARNFEDLAGGLAEIRRVLRRGAPLVVLEFSRPRVFPVKQLFGFYFRHVLPTVGRLVSGDAGAYTYLPESVQHFPDGEAFAAVMRHAGFSDVRVRPLTFGIATVYSGAAN
jgi:demethylmenaquinone methyltransferase / 2-methoxy-6-polyprenyl-1,4-benzoquinol methylase